jgi:alkylation response protein AidB-like acyl-CoA dehydrogenase
MEAQMEKEYMKGGEFLIAETNTDAVFTPEDFSDEHRMIGDTCREYIDNEVAPSLPELEKHNWELARELLKKAGELGLLGANIPEEYGGMGLDQVSGCIIAEMVGRGSGFGCFRYFIGVLRI